MEPAFNRIVGAWRGRTIIAKLFSFAAIGVVNTAVDVTTFSIAYQLLHIPLVMSNVIAWIVAVSGSYTMNTKVTFGRETGGAFRWNHFLRFSASGVLGAIVATATLVILSQYTNVFLAKFASILASFGLNFSTSHFFVFRAATPNTKTL